MLKSVKNTILDIIRQAVLLLLALCTVTSLFGVVMIYSATRYQGGLKCVIIQLCGWRWALCCISWCPWWT